MPDRSDEEARMLEAMIREVDAKTARAHRDTRIVPMTREQRNTLIESWQLGSLVPDHILLALVEAWDAAPASATQAAAKAIYESEVDPGVTWENARAKTHDECTGMALAVLRALGVPADA